MSLQPGQAIIGPKNGPTEPRAAGSSTKMRCAIKAGGVAILLILGGTLAAHGQVLKTIDVSPDQSTFTYNVPGLIDPAGRIKSLIIDPNNDAILYAGAEISGVWKSTAGFLVAGPNFGANDAGKMKWFQSSNGLRNGVTMNQYSLAIDPSVQGVDAKGRKYSKRLLYASGNNDGRPGNPDAGLWVSTDAAVNWSHVALCGAGKDGISSVIFSGGQPFVATQCGIWTTTSPDLNSSWKQLTASKIVLGGAFLADGGKGTFFACWDNIVFPASELGQKWGLGVTLSRGVCRAMAAVPHDPTSTQALVVRSDGTSSYEVTLVDFGVSPPKARDLGFSPFADNNSGSGVPAVAAVRRGAPMSSTTPPVAGLTYDIYAADSCAWFQFDPITIPKIIPAWQMVAPGGGGQCHFTTTTIHADTWAMVFPTWYDTNLGICAAYAATDGGVFFTGGLTAPVPGIPGGCATTPWLPAQTGLHVLESQTMAAISQGALPYSRSFPLALYLPTGDNDVFVSHLANCKDEGGSTPVGCDFLPTAWQNLEFGSGDFLGDAGLVLADPLYPQQVLASRNDQNGRNYVAVDDPPLPAGPTNPSGTYTQIIEPSPPLPTGATFDGGTGMGDLSTVYTLSAEFPVKSSSSGAPSTPPFVAIQGDYLAVEDDSPEKKEVTPPTGCEAGKHDHILRNPSGSPPNHLAWVDLSDFFLACDIVKAQPAGGHKSPTVYVLTNLDDDKSTPPVSYPPAKSGQTYGPGQIYKGVIVALNDVPGTGKISTWVSASGSKQNPLKQADDFFVNPYDANELYAVDLKDQVIMYSTDGGANWYKDDTLTGFATNHGEYVMGCYSSVGRPGESATDPFTNVCSLSGMAFDPFWPQARVAAMLYGGIAFSRDSGHHWMALDVTDNNHFLSDNLTEAVDSVFIDGETRLSGVPTNDQVIYAALHGRGLIRVQGPFRDLVSVNFTFNPAGTSCASAPVGTEKQSQCVQVVIPSLSQTLQLRKDPDGNFRGSLLLSTPATLSPLVYTFIAAGKSEPISLTYIFTSSDLNTGVATVPMAP